jgi:hypothetical protein
MAIDLGLLATIVQTIVITLTLLVFIFQFRSQEKAIKESSYQNVLGRYNDYVMSGTPTDDLLLSRLFSRTQELSPAEIAGVRRLMIAYGILEEVFELYEKKWIDKKTWEQWEAWLRSIRKYPQFALLHNATTGMYDKGFQERVSQLIAQQSADGKTTDLEKSKTSTNSNV